MSFNEQVDDDMQNKLVKSEGSWNVVTRHGEVGNYSAAINSDLSERHIYYN